MSDPVTPRRGYTTPLIPLRPTGQMPELPQLVATGAVERFLMAQVEEVYRAMVAQTANAPTPSTEAVPAQTPSQA